MAFDNPVGDAHSETGIGHAFGGKKGIENPSFHLVGHTNPCIGNPHLNPILCRMVGGDGELPSLGHGIDGIENDIGQDFP